MTPAEIKERAHQLIDRLAPDRLSVLVDLLEGRFAQSIPPDSLNVRARLDELSALRDGWLNGEGVAPAEEKLSWLTNMFETHFSRSLPLPWLYPTPEGGIQAEWSLDNWEVSVEIDLNRETGSFQALNRSDRTTREFSLSLADPIGWKHLNAALQELGGRALVA